MYWCTGQAVSWALEAAAAAAEMVEAEMAVVE